MKNSQEEAVYEVVSDARVTDLKTIHLGLSRMYRLMQALGNPQNERPIVHVAGTNGKGSTISFLQSICMEAGLLVGCFTSPAVFDQTEVLRINHSCVSAEELEDLERSLSQTIEDTFDKEEQPSPFERMTAKAFLFFRRKKPDLILLETGLGGDEDATNCYSQEAQLCSVITPIGLDHCDFLGDTVEKIALHKAGIMRRGKPVVLGIQQKAVKQVLLNCAKKKDSVVCKVDERQLRLQSDVPVCFCYKQFEHLTLSVCGRVQAENAACAIEAAFLIRKAGYSITDEAIVRGVKNMTFPGRLEVFDRDGAGGTDRVILLDGAHNLQAAQRLRETISQNFSQHRKYFICGFLRDKNYSEVSELVFRDFWDGTYHIDTVQAMGERALSAKALADVIAAKLPEENHITLAAVADAKRAMKRALKWLDHSENKPSAVIAFGSFSWLLAARSEIMQERN